MRRRSALAGPVRDARAAPPTTAAHTLFFLARALITANPVGGVNGA
jgi:hypothetical protein